MVHGNSRAMSRALQELPPPRAEDVEWKSGQIIAAEVIDGRQVRFRPRWLSAFSATLCVRLDAARVCRGGVKGAKGANWAPDWQVARLCTFNNPMASAVPGIAYRYGLGRRSS